MKKTKIPPNLILTAVLSAGLTIVFSLLYISLCSASLVYRFNCDVGENHHGANYFWNTLYNAYIQDEQCAQTNEPVLADVTDSHRVFILIITTLCASTVTFAIAVTLIAVIQNEAQEHIYVVVNSYVFVTISALIVDIVFAVHFGSDYFKYQSELAALPVGEMNYEKEIYRIGALIFMTIALKGYIAHVINIVLVTLLLVYTADFQKLRVKSNHSIHKLGVVNAYDSQRRHDENGPQQQEPYRMPFPRSPNLYPIFMDDEQPRSPVREPSRSAYPNQAFDRADSWQHSHPGQGESRPFSYLAMTSTSIKSEPAAEPWRRNWAPGPALPAPDYSPLQGRRLKSALKPHDV